MGALRREDDWPSIAAVFTSARSSGDRDDPDASRPSAERDKGGPSRHELRAPCSSFGSDGGLTLIFSTGFPRTHKAGADRRIGR